MALESDPARIEALFRAINERICEVVNRFRIGSEEIEFICECADPTCTERVHLTFDQYENVRSLSTRFVVVPGHEATPLVERVVFRNPSFSVVAKVGVAGDVADEADPRRDRRNES
jgi:hypothetical protein